MGMEVISMTNQNSKSGTNSMAVPEAKSAMNRFKEEARQGGHQPPDECSREAGSIGGEMVKKMIMKQEQQMSSGQ